MNKELEDIESILYEALSRVGAEEREAYLEAACGANTELRAEIDSLLLAYGDEKGLLKAPSDLLEEPVDTVTEGPGTTIGRYKLLEKIGEGGMAVVYMAEQQEPIRRKVALKIIKLGMDTRQVIARFEVERQALAMMDHPNIAKVLDAPAASCEARAGAGLVYPGLQRCSARAPERNHSSGYQAIQRDGHAP
jgi:hypothetical protein